MCALRFKFDFHWNLHHGFKQCLEFSVQLGLILVAPQGHGKGIGLFRSVIIPSVDVPDDQEHGAVRRRIESLMEYLAAELIRSS